jgi:predicted metalloendopeptidase
MRKKCEFSSFQFDEHGNLKQWWHHEALQRFKDRARCMIEQYSAYKVKEINMMINGFKTQGENIADNGGILQSYTVSLFYIQRSMIPKARLKMRENAIEK